MARNLIGRYIWIVDTIMRYKRLTLKQLSELWLRSDVNDGAPLPRRTFFNYRDAIADTFGIDILCDKATFEYYIEQENNVSGLRIQQWMLNNASVNDMLANAQQISERVVLDNVPDSRGFLPIVIDAMKQNKRIAFDYRSYQRVNAARDIVIEPYFVKIFKQVWYVIGYNIKDRKIKTYALDRVLKMNITSETFVMPESMTPSDFFADCFGIITNQSEPKDIVLRVTATQAKYLRAVPLHSSQREEIHDNYSLFYYRMRITYDLRAELLSLGSEVQVLQPRELKVQMMSELQKSLKNYTD